MKCSLLAGICLAAVVTVSGQAQAQTASDIPAAPSPIQQGSPEPLPQSDETAADQDIVVTGSRAIADGSQAPTPITVTSGEQLAKSNPGLIGESLNVLPAFRGSTRPTTGVTSATGPNAGSFLNLRNLGIQRTLVLLDGRRAAPSSREGATDANLLPSELVRRVDVVTGGASAAYGSDAVAGVVNFVLDTRYEGLKGNLQSGISERGDGGSIKASLTGGQSFAGDRGRIVASASYFRTDEIGSSASRDWAASNTGFLTNPAVPGQLVFRDNLRSATAASGGLILSGPLILRQFAPDGTLRPFSRGSAQSGLIQVGGDGAQAFTSLSAGIETQSYFAHAEFDIAPRLTLFAQGSLGLSDTRYNQIQQFNLVGFNGFTIFSGNAFLNPAVQQVLTQTNTPAFALGRINFDFGDPARAISKARTVDLTAGFKYAGDNGFAIDGYYERGRNRTTIRTVNNVALERLYAAADAVRDPATSQPVCRVTLTNPGLYTGCVPINLFGVGAPSQAAIDYVSDDSAYRTTIRQDVADLVIRGRPFATWAGDVSLATGGTYRRVSLDQVTNPISNSVNDATGIRGFPAAYQNQPGGLLLTNVFQVSGSFNLWEVFGEAAVPLARNLPLLHSLDINGAVRYIDYSTSGGVTTWKAGAVWEPVEGVRLRGTASRDIRAPNVPELFAGIIQQTGSVIENSATVPVIVATSGNSGLQPEIARTYTGGIVLQPAFAPGLTLSVDYYSIDVDGIITALTPQVTLDQCRGGNTALCANITRNAAGVITRVTSPTLNLNELKSTGVDIELGYRPREKVLGGDLGLRFVASYLGKQEQVFANGSSIDRAGEVGLSSNPRWNVVGNVTWGTDDFELFAQQRFISAGRYDVTRVQPTTIEDNRVDRVFYTDVTASFKLDRQFRFYLTVNNLFDKDPPLAPNGTLVQFIPTNFQLYDVVGRYITAGINLSF